MRSKAWILLHNDDDPNGISTRFNLSVGKRLATVLFLWYTLGKNDKKGVNAIFYVRTRTQGKNHHFNCDFRVENLDYFMVLA